jgi:hypothetical protein
MKEILSGILNNPFRERSKELQNKVGWHHSCIPRICTEVSRLHHDSPCIFLCIHGTMYQNVASASLCSSCSLTLDTFWIREKNYNINLPRNKWINKQILSIINCQIQLPPTLALLLFHQPQALWRWKNSPYISLVVLDLPCSWSNTGHFACDSLERTH